MRLYRSVLVWALRLIATVSAASALVQMTGVPSLIAMFEAAERNSGGASLYAVAVQPSLTYLIGALAGLTLAEILALLLRRDASRD